MSGGAFIRGLGWLEEIWYLAWLEKTDKRRSSRLNIVKPSHILLYNHFEIMLFLLFNVLYRFI